MYRIARRISLVALTLVLVAGLGACKKKPKEKKDGADPMAKGPEAMEFDRKNNLLPL